MFANLQTYKPRLSILYVLLQGFLLIACTNSSQGNNDNNLSASQTQYTQKPTTQVANPNCNPDTHWYQDSWTTEQANGLFGNWNTPDDGSNNQYLCQDDFTDSFCNLNMTPNQGYSNAPDPIACQDGYCAFYQVLYNGCYCLTGCATQLVCNSGYALCSDNLCHDTQNDPANCGSCGNECESKKCNQGQCAPFICPGNPDYNTDANNCGSCGNKCGSNQACYQGSCVAKGGAVCRYSDTCAQTECPRSDGIYSSCCTMNGQPIPNCYNCCTLGT